MTPRAKWEGWGRRMLLWCSARRRCPGAAKMHPGELGRSGRAVAVGSMADPGSAYPPPMAQWGLEGGAKPVCRKVLDLLSIKPPKMSKITINGNCAPRYPLGPGVWPRAPSPRAGAYPKAHFVLIAQGLVPTAPVCSAKSSKSAPERCTGDALARRWRKYHALGHAPRLPPGPRAAAGAAPPPLRGLVRASRA